VLRYPLAWIQALIEVTLGAAGDSSAGATTVVVAAGVGARRIQAM
jgi:hypothetical protein